LESQLFWHWLLPVLSVRLVVIPVLVRRFRTREWSVFAANVPGVTEFVVTASPTIMRMTTITHTHRPGLTDSRRANKALKPSYGVRHIQGLA